MEKVTVSKNEYDVLRDENRLLREQVSLLMTKLYGPKSERHEDDSDEVQERLFEDSKPEPEDEPVEEEQVAIAGHQRRKRGRKPIDDDLPRQIVEVDVEESEKVCGCCGKQRPELPPKTNQVVNYTPAKLDVIRYERKTYGECPTCSGSQDAASGVVTAEAVKQLIPQSMATPSLLAYLIKIMKYGEAELSMNWVENAIRPFVIGRKGWLFSGSPKGAKASAILHSLIETAKHNQWNPRAYLQSLFEKLPHAKTDEDLRALLPYNLERC